jgi:hypothetical protein
MPHSGAIAALSQAREKPRCYVLLTSRLGELRKELNDA